MGEMEFFLILLHLVPGIRDKTIYKVLRALYFERISPSRFLEFPFEVYRERFGLLEVSANALGNQLDNLIYKAREASEKMRELGFRAVSVFDETYPSKLKDFMDYPPPIIYARGDMELLNSETFSLLNSRDADERCMRLSLEAGKNFSGVAVGGLYGRNYRFFENIGGKRVAVSDRGIFQITKRRLNLGFDAIISFSGLDDMGTPGSMLMRDRVVVALSDVIVGICIREGGNMDKLLREAAQKGKEILLAEVDYNGDKLGGLKPLKI